MPTYIQTYELIKQVAAELRFITPENGYVIDIKEVLTDYIPLNAENTFNSICVWSGDDVPGSAYVSNIPAESTITLYIDCHLRTEKKSLSLTELIETMKFDLRRWCYRTTGITANKYLTIGENASQDAMTGAQWKAFSLGTFKVSRLEGENIALLQVPLVVNYDLLFI